MKQICVFNTRLVSTTIDFITQYMEHFSELSYWLMFIETGVFGEYFLKILVKN